MSSEEGEVYATDSDRHAQHGLGDLHLNLTRVVMYTVRAAAVRGVLRNAVRRFSSADNRQTFSTVWQAVDGNRHDGSKLVTPDPLDYLRGFDSTAAVKPYKQSLLSACNLRSGESVVDVGCGLGQQTANLCNAVEPSGRVCAVDKARDAVAEAAVQNAAHGRIAEFIVADAYSLPFAESTFDCAVADRVLQHLVRPLEAAAEIARVVKPGGRLVFGDPDWRSFAIDVPGAGGFGEAGRRWGESRRPDGELAFDLGAMTAKVLNGVIPTLTAHSYIGLALPRLLNALGCIDEVELRCVPMALRGWEELERVVPITYFTTLAANNGGISRDEGRLWLERLKWEGANALTGTLCMYVASARKRSMHHQLIRPSVSRSGSSCGGGEEECDSSRAAVRTRLATKERDLPRAAELSRLINEVYAVSDTGITLSSPRCPTEAVEGFIERGELIIAEAVVERPAVAADCAAQGSGRRIESSIDQQVWTRWVGGDGGGGRNCGGVGVSDPLVGAGAGSTLLGCIQVEVKGRGVNQGLPVKSTIESEVGHGGNSSSGNSSDSDGDSSERSGGSGVGEFACLAVRAHARHRSGRGVGAMLVRAAEAHCRSEGCGASACTQTRPYLLPCCPDIFLLFFAFPLLRHSDLMQMGILSLAEDEPEYKKWLARWYLRLGYEHRETLTLRFEPDEVSEMYSYLKQRVPCKYVLFDKRL